MSKELVVRTPTQAIYDAVVAQAVSEGKEPLGDNKWPKYHENTCVGVSGYLHFSPEEFFQEHSPDYKLIDAKDYLKERTMENLQAGDILVNDDYDYSLTVQGGIGAVIFTISTDTYKTSQLWSVEELERADWKLKDSDPEITELTLTQVSEKFNIPLEKLRIKE